MKSEKILYLGVAFWILETAYFGWNQTAQSAAERVSDLIAGALMGYGMIATIAEGAAEKWLREHIKINNKSEDNP